MNNKRKNLGFLLAGLVLLPGCMHVPTYKNRSLSTFQNTHAYSCAKNGVVLHAKVLTEDDIEHLFGKSSQLINNDLRVIYVSIHNLSTEPYVLSRTGIDRAMLSHQKVARYMKTHSIINLASIIPAGYTTYWGIRGLVFGAFVAGPIIGYSGVALAVIGIGSGFTAFGMGIKSMIMNGRIKKDLKAKMLRENVVIESGDKYEGLIFVKAADYTPEFTVTMRKKNKAKKSITFDVNLSQNEY